LEWVQKGTLSALLRNPEKEGMNFLWQGKKTNLACPVQVAILTSEGASNLQVWAILAEEAGTTEVTRKYIIQLSTPFCEAQKTCSVSCNVKFRVENVFTPSTLDCDVFKPKNIGREALHFLG